VDAERRQYILGLAARHFHRNLKGRARKYLTVERGLAQQTIKQFRVGYAPREKGLLHFLKKHGVKIQEAIEAGVFFRGKDGRLRAFFRNRVVFPLVRKGSVLNLVGRILPGGEQPEPANAPRYLTLRNPNNEPSPRVFFGEASVQKGQRLLITEGPIDALSAVQVGFTAVSTRGLHVSKRNMPHLVKLCRKAGSAFIIFDAEASGAGSKGAEALGKKLWTCGVRVRIVQLPLAKRQKKIDLAEFIQAKGEDAKPELDKLTARAPTWLEWEIENIPKDLPKPDLPARLRPLLVFAADLVGIEQEHFRKLVCEKFELTKHAIDEEIELAVFQQQTALAARASKTHLTPTEREQALAILKRPSLLFDLKRMVQRQGVRREGRNVLLLGLAMTSRLLEDPLSVVVKGQSSAGKSFLVERVAKVFPPEEVHTWSGMSAKVLVYTKRDYRHKVLVVLERKGGEPAQESMRYLQSEKLLIYEVVIKNPRTGEFETKQYRHEGPVACVTTTTEAVLQVDDENRSFSISPDESDEQTALVMKSNLEQKLAGTTGRKFTEDELLPWHNAQRLLAEQRVQVVFPKWFKAVCKKLPTRPLRMRRDWPRFLALCEAVVLLHQFQRPREQLADGTVRLTVTLEDYAIARIVGKDALRRSLLQIPPNTMKIIEAVKRLDEYQAGVTYQRIMEMTGMTYATVYKWAKPALQAGYLHYSEERVKSNVKRLREGQPPSKEKLLPSPLDILKLHPELGSCRYVHPVTGDSRVVKAPSNPQKATKPANDSDTRG
jgi:DNA primase